MEVIPMRTSVKQFVKIVSETLPTPEPIYEFGSWQNPDTESLADLRPLFPGKEYVGCDMREGPGVDRVISLHSIDLPSESVGTVLIMDTLEHVEFPWKAIAEAHRILRPNGILVFSSHKWHPIHYAPSDYWRFTPEAFKSLLRPFASQFVGFAGESGFPHIVAGIGFRSPVSEDRMDEFIRRFEEWKRQARTEPRSLRGWVKLFTPPILVDLYRRIRGLY